MEKGLINDITLMRTMERSRRQKAKLGIVLEEIGLITGDELADALSSQYGFRVVKDFAKYRYAPELLQLIPAEIAIKHHMFPLKAASGRLAVAMSDLTNTEAAANIAERNNLMLVPFVASIKDIKSAIDRHYAKHDSHAKPAGQTPQSILLVEDDRLTYTILRNILSKKGYRVLLALNGLEAYRMVLEERPDVIITDKVMPQLDGYGLQAALRALPETRDIPVIMISSSNNNNEEACAFEKGFFDYLSKPIKDTTLLVRVERAILFAKK